jgi:hypothetical protein
MVAGVACRRAPAAEGDGARRHGEPEHEGAGEEVHANEKLTRSTDLRSGRPEEDGDAGNERGGDGRSWGG